MKKYFINNGQNNIGPYDMPSIVKMVNSADIKATDRMCINMDQDEWIMICEHPEFLNYSDSGKGTSGKATQGDKSARHEAVSHAETGTSSTVQTIVKHTKSGVSPMEAVSAAEKGHLAAGDAGLTITDLIKSQWYIMKGKSKLGPFTYLDVVKMLQEKSTFEYDFAWCQGLTDWKRIAELPCFGPDQVKNLFESKETENIFFRRSHSRSHYECHVIVHDNNQIWNGRTVEIGEGGAGVIIENAMLVPGQNIYLHFKAGEKSKPFNALSEIVSKKYAKGIKDAAAPVVYGIKFINITKQDRELIKQIRDAA